MGNCYDSISRELARAAVRASMCIRRCLTLQGCRSRDGAARDVGVVMKYTGKLPICGGRPRTGHAQNDRSWLHMCDSPKIWEV